MRIKLDLELNKNLDGKVKSKIADDIKLNITARKRRPKFAQKIRMNFNRGNFIFFSFG